jgi:hypothetical protein
MGSSCFRQVSIARWPVSRFTPNPNKQKPTYPTNGQSDPPANGLPYTLLKSATQNFRISEVSKRNNQEVDHANYLFKMPKNLYRRFRQDTAQNHQHPLQNLWKRDFTSSGCAAVITARRFSDTVESAVRHYANHLSVL